jgi:hypothetical protein
LGALGGVNEASVFGSESVYRARDINGGRDFGWCVDRRAPLNGAR